MSEPLGDPRPPVHLSTTVDFAARALRALGAAHRANYEAKAATLAAYTTLADLDRDSLLAVASCLAALTLMGHPGASLGVPPMDATNPDPTGWEADPVGTWIEMMEFNLAGLPAVPPPAAGGGSDA